MRLALLIDLSVLQRLTEANYQANGMPIGIVDAADGSVLVGCGWQDICLAYHRRNAVTLERCRESDDLIKKNLSATSPSEYTCRNGLRDIGIPIVVAGEHLATLFLGQFFYAGESPDREFFVAQARAVGFDEAGYLAALDRVPQFTRAQVENILRYDQALATFISELAERALAHARAEEALREGDRRKSEFVAMLSHELRNPLAPIRNALYLLERGDAAPEKAAEAVAIATRQLRHLTRMVDDLMDVRRLSRGEYQLDRHRLDLAAVVREAAEDHRPFVEERGIALHVRASAGPLWIEGDAARLTQIVGNLLRNATRFNDPGGTVVISLERAGDGAVLRVRDDGIGMGAEVLGKLFQPFEQFDTTLHRGRGGLGLGLSVVKSLVERHGGSVQASSPGEGRGSEFVVRLPLARPAAPSPPAPAPHAARHRVLVIEDNEDAAETLKEVLELEGHDVRVALDGLHGIEAALRFRPEVVLCDIGLPGIDGYEVARRLRRAQGFPGTLVAVTGYSSAEDVRRAAAAGFDHHVAKPADLDELVRLVAEAPVAAVH